MTDESPTITQSPEEIAAMRPLAYLRGQGPLDDSGQPREDLAGAFTSAACLAFESGGLSPQELALVYESLKQCMPLAIADTASQRFQTGVDHAFNIVAGFIGQEINDALQDWIQEWFPLIESDACTDAFMVHMSAALSQYALIISLKHDD
ncbi:MAG: hypothetical protein AAGK04_02230 [Planctomycetota bacterium]